jgi:hypothetical protein
MADAASTTPKTPKRTTAKKPAATKTTAAAKKPAAARKPAAPKSNTAVAKSRFNAALEEAKAGAAALGAEAKERAGS